MALRVLVIEDNELARFTMCEILEDAGYDVAEATSGDEGIALQDAQPFALVITDIIMPKKDGLETIRELKEAYPELPIIAVSGGGRTRDHDVLDRARDVGADCILHKPFTATELKDLAADTLNPAG